MGLALSPDGKWLAAGRYDGTLGVYERFVFYPELGLAGLIERGDGWGGVSPNVGFGGRYYLLRSVSVMGRLGWPMAISLGATF